jgi:hypothetical protein
MQTAHSAPGRLLASLALLALSAVDLAAQCPDGTPPPCNRGAAAAPRRANPQLNPRAWIVVPFGNAMKAQDLDWLREASVNLLSMDMSRWTDVDVVPDKRVGDLLRELPATRTASALTLNDGLTVARRAGAGKLVMGDFFKIGKGARIIANVFDVRSGAKIRSITHQAPETDSLLTAFTPLARGVLAVPPPPDAKAGELGTSSLDAYQAYLLGVRALHRGNLIDARTQLMRALSFDSTFALAHLQLSTTLSWLESPLTTKEAQVHAFAAQRLGTLLPPRERALIVGRVANAASDYPAACTAFASLVAKDSTDVEALFELGECSYHDATVDPGPSDSVPGAFRWSWNTTMRALTRAVALDPSFHPAFVHVLDILRATDRAG